MFAKWYGIKKNAQKKFHLLGELNSGHSRGGGRPRWKVVTLSSVFFLNPSLSAQHIFFGRAIILSKCSQKQTCQQNLDLQSQVNFHRSSYLGKIIFLLHSALALWCRCQQAIMFRDGASSHRNKTFQMLKNTKKCIIASKVTAILLNEWFCLLVELHWKESACRLVQNQTRGFPLFILLFVSFSVTLRVPPLDSETGWTGELWWNRVLPILEN